MPAADLLFFSGKKVSERGTTSLFPYFLCLVRSQVSAAFDDSDGGQLAVRMADRRGPERRRDR